MLIWLVGSIADLHTTYAGEALAYISVRCSEVVLVAGEAQGMEHEFRGLDMHCLLTVDLLGSLSSG